MAASLRPRARSVGRGPQDVFVRVSSYWQVGPAHATEENGGKDLLCYPESLLATAVRARAAAMATAAATMNMATHHPRARTRARLHVCAAWDMNPGAATVAVPKPSKAKPKPPPTPARPPPTTHADLFARSSEGQGTVSCPHHVLDALCGRLKLLRSLSVACCCSNADELLSLKR